MDQHPDTDDAAPVLRATDDPAYDEAEQQQAERDAFADLLLPPYITGDGKRHQTAEAALAHAGRVLAQTGVFISVEKA